MTLGGERAAVQDPLIRYAAEAGWEYLTPEEARRLRRGDTGLVLHEVLVGQLQRLNPGVVDHLRAEETSKRLSLVSPTGEGNREAWEFLKGLKSVFVEEERRERNVAFLDLGDVGRNVFHVTDELTYANGNHKIRADVVFLVNGVPVLFVEAKAATRVEGIAEALDQVRRYHREGPELMALLQLFSLTHLVGFYYGATWNTSRKSLYNWRDENVGDFEALVKTFVEPGRLLRVISDYILFARKDEELQKVVLRPHQIRAVEKIEARAKDPGKRRGLVWHTQGSGKTYTMITVAKKRVEEPAFENPTVLMLVDRNELEAQLFQNLEATDFGNVEVARSKRNLVALLRGDRRGLIVSTIHKFDDVPAGANTRENVEPTGYKAFLVGADREACTLYKRELDKHLPPEYSEVVISPAHNDPPGLADFHLREDEEQRVRKSFRKGDELPKILIVTEKLLTGYDAPILYCMYLDKPMRDHVLLQAIARVNRPHEDEEGRRKPAGFVLDFVGIFDKLEKALAFDSEEVRGVVEGVEVLRHRFAVLMDGGREAYLSPAGGSLDDKAVEAVLQRFRDREERQTFYKFFREVEELHEILSPAPFLRPFVGDFERLTRMYQLLRSAYEPNVPVDKTLMRKTARLVEEYTGTGLIGEPRTEYALNPATLEQLARANDKPETVRIFNLLKEVRKLVDEGNGVAYLVPIGERAEAIAESFEERQSTTGEALRDLEKGLIPLTTVLPFGILKPCPK